MRFGCGGSDTRCPSTASTSLLRITFDNAAGFSWGTNWIYLIVPREDFGRGELDRVVVTGANS